MYCMLELHVNSLVHRDPGLSEHGMRLACFAEPQKESYLGLLEDLEACRAAGGSSSRACKDARSAVSTCGCGGPG